MDSLLLKRVDGCGMVILQPGVSTGTILICKQEFKTINFLTKGCAYKKGHCESMRCGCRKMEVHVVQVVDVKAARISLYL